MTPASPTGARPHRRRGMVVLVVLVVLAILSAIVVSQFSVVTSNTVLATRSADDAKARALAESCLTMMQTYADRFLGASLSTATDFDGLLNPDNDPAIGGNEFLPPIRSGDVKVLLPKGLSGSSDFLQRHTWLLVQQPIGSERGACLLRYDDNSDDGLALSTLSTGSGDDDDEGGGGGATPTTPVDNVYKDRDRAIYMTAIGLFPYLSATAATDAYGAAHARVTLRRLYGNNATGAPTIHVGNDISGMKGAICSNGIGLVTGGVAQFKSSAFASPGCACGQLVSAESMSSPSACSGVPDCPCAPQSTSIISPTSFDVSALTNRLQSLRPPGDWSAAAQANFVFANQNFGPAPRSGTTPEPVDLSANDLGGGRRSCKLFFDNAGSVFVWDRNEPGCAPYTNDPVQRPCTAGWTGTGPGTFTGACLTGETKCWRRVHSGGGTWTPGSTIPNVAGPGTRKWTVTASSPASEYLCGAPDSMTSGSASGATFAPSATATGAWTFDRLRNSKMPTPAYILVENNPLTTTTLVSSPGDNNELLNATFVAAGGVQFDSRPLVCGVGCDCSGITASFSAGDCTLTEAATATAAAGQCSVVRAFGTCTVSAVSGNNSVLVGQARCGSIDFDPAGLCVIGGVASMSTDSTAECGELKEKSCLTPIHLCLDDVAGVIGDIYSATSLVVRNADIFTTLTGTVAAEASMCTKDSLRIDGSVVVGQNLGFKGFPIVSSSSGVSVSALRAMVETAW